MVMQFMQNAVQISFEEFSFVFSKKNFFVLKFDDCAIECSKVKLRELVEGFVGLLLFWQNLWRPDFLIMSDCIGILQRF